MNGIKKKNSGWERETRIEMSFRTKRLLKKGLIISAGDSGDALKVRGSARVRAITVPLELTR